MRGPVLVLIVPLVLAGACTRPGGAYPSLGARAAEAIDPRLPIAEAPSPGALDPELTARLGAALALARGGIAEFDRLDAIASRAAAAAGAPQSESWIVAQQALSALVAQNGLATRAAADVDALAATRIENERWIAPANRNAIEQAGQAIGAINRAQSARIAQLSARLGG